MAASETFTDTFEDNNIQSYKVLSYICDDNGEFVDFSERLEVNGRNFLLKIGTIQHVTELKAGGGGFHTKVGSVVMDNAPQQPGATYSLCSGWFDQPFPASLKTIYGNVASFPLSSDNQHSVLYRHHLKLGLRAYLKDETVEDISMGVFLIDGEKMDREAATLTLKLIGLPKALMDTDISNMKDGLGWYQNRSYPFLIQEIIKRSDLADSGAVPSGYTIPDIVNTETADLSRTLSPFGRPPEWDGTKWQEKGYTCRALEWCDAGNGSRLYMGCDEHIYEYDPSKDTYTLLTTNLTSGAYVRRLWYNSNYGSNEERIWGVAWADVTNTPGSMPIPSQITMKIFSIDLNLGDGRTYQVEEQESITDVFPGDFSYRYGTSDATTTSIGQRGVTESGENIAIPFKQTVRIMETNVGPPTSPTDWFSQTSIFDGTNATSDVSGLTADLDKGLYGFRTYEVGVYDAGHRWSMGQVGVVSFNANYDYDGATQKGAILFVTASTKNYTYKIYDIGKDAIRTIATDYQLNSEPIQPTCGCESGADDDFYIGAMAWYDSGDVNSRSYIVKMSPPTDGVAASISVRYDSSGNEVNGDSVCSSRTFLEIIYNSSGPEELYLSIFERENVLTADSHIIATYDASDTDSELVTVSKGSGQFKGLMEDNENADVWSVNCASGALVQVDISDTSGSTSGTAIIADQGYPIVYGDTNLSSNLVSIPHAEITILDSLTRTNDVIFGVSAPNYPAETQVADPDGKYYLWKYDRYVSGRVELADFEDMNGWDALKLFAEASGYLMGFDVDGDFFFVSRPSSASADFVFICDGEYSRIDNVTQDMGYGEIYNYVKITPYRVVKKEPEAELIAIEPPEGTFEDGDKDIDRPPPPDYSVSHRDGNRKSLRLICTKDGKVGDATDYPLFKWITYQNIIETYFAEDVAELETTDIKLGSVFGGNGDDDGIHDGDYIVVQDPTYKQDIIREITNVDADDDEIDISKTESGGNNEFKDKDGTNVTFAIGDEVRILKRAKVDSNATYKQWSDDGVTYVTVEVDTTNFDVEDAQDLEVGTVVILEYTSGGTSYSEQRVISAIDRSASPVRITVSAAFAVAPPVNTVVKAYFGVTSWDNYFPIGGTNLWIIFHEPASAGEGTKWTARMFKGDIFDINCEGLVLESDDQSVKTVYDATSRSKYGKRPFTGLENKFLHHKLAKDRARKIVSDYASPKRIITVIGSLIPHLTFLKSTGALKQIAVRDRVLFPLAENNQVVGYPRAISHSPINHNTTVTFREI